MARSMYGAYRAAGRAGGAYRASLQDIENVGYEKEHSAKMYEMDVQSREATLGAITEGISLASNIYGGYQAKKERDAEIESFGKSEYEASLKEDVSWGEDISDVKEWGDLSSAEKSKWGPQQTYGETKLWDLLRGKAKLGEGETKWGEAGERLNVLFGGERKYDWQGKDWTSSELSAKFKLGRAEERGLPVEGISGDKDKITELQDKFKEKEEGYQFSESGSGSESWFGEKVEKMKSKNWNPTDFFSSGTSLEKYNPQLLTMAEESGWTGKSWQ